MSHRARPRIQRIVALLEQTHGPQRWRPRGPAIDGLVGTILSQNTSDTNSGAAYRALRAAFDSWEAVMRAPATRIARAIRTAGLANVKSVRIKRVLQQIYAERGELSLQFLRRLPLEQARAYLGRFEGVGPKTVACVLMFNLNLPVLPVDTHVHRVSLRLGLIPPGTSAERAHELLAEQVPDELVYRFHVLLVQHGRQICAARRPDCPACALRRICAHGKRRSTAPRS
jgi:endonuclease-3